MKRERKMLGRITYKVKATHPDMKYIENKEEVFTYSDTYILDRDVFEDYEAMEYIACDLALIANGGYELGHIDIIELSIC